MAEDLMEFVRDFKPSNPFKPYYELSRKADALTFRTKPDADYSVRLTDSVTLFRSIDNDQITGCRIKGIAGILEDLPNYITVDGGDKMLSILFLPFRGEAVGQEARDAINELARAGRDMKLEEAPA
jgi:hypothetical protein